MNLPRILVRALVGVALVISLGAVLAASLVGGQDPALAPRQTITIQNADQAGSRQQSSPSIAPRDAAPPLGGAASSDTATGSRAGPTPSQGGGPTHHRSRRPQGLNPEVGDTDGESDVDAETNPGRTARTGTGDDAPSTD